MAFPIKQMDLKNITLSDMSEKDKYSRISLICMESTKTKLKKHFV